MTKSQENPDAMTEPVLQPAAEPSPGETVRSVREARGLSQAQVAEALHLTVHFVNALENDHYKKLPGRTFVKGYFKSYARLLQIDAVELVSRFERYMDAREEPQADAYRSISRRRRHHDQNVRWLAVATCLLLLVVGGAWWFGRETSGSALTLPRVAQQTPAPPAAAEPARDRTADLIAASQAAPAAVTAESLDAEAGLPGDVSAGAPATLLDSSTLPGAGAQVDTPPAAPAPAATPVDSEPSPLALDLGVAGAAPVSDGTASAGAEAGAAPGATAAPALTPSLDAADAAPASNTLSVQSTESGRGRQLSLGGEGDDTLVITLHGTSWLAVRNHENNALFNDNLHDGDELTLRGQAPFNLVIGDAHQVQLRFNARPVDLSSHIRADRTARLSLQP